MLVNIDHDIYIAEDYALFIECKYTARGSSSNAWMVSEMATIRAAMKKSHDKRMPAIRTKDGWTWVHLDDFLEYMWFCIDSSNEISIESMFNIVQKNKNMSKFFMNAIEQAKAAELPKRPGKNPYSHRMHVVCVGSNIRAPKCVGIPPNSIVKL